MAWMVDKWFLYHRHPNVVFLVLDHFVLGGDMYFYSTKGVSSVVRV